MKILDPRLWAIHRPRTVLSVFLGLVCLLSWGNLCVRRGGVLDHDIILREDDPVRHMDVYVRAKVNEGFEGREFIPVILKSGGVRSASDLQKILRMTEAAEEAFGRTVVSLSTVPAYQDTGVTLLDEPYITSKGILQDDFALPQWKKKVASDPGVFGLLVGRDFSWSSVIRYLPPGYDEITEFRNTVEFLEGRAIPWWEWLWKKDIIPRDPTLGVGGWTIGRGLIDQGLNVDILTLVFLGVLLTVPIFWGALGSCRSAVLCVGVMVLGGFWGTRGLMGLLGIPERVFSLLAYASVVVQGTSFALHKFQAVRESGERDLALGWQKARSVDSLITITACIAVFGFLSLWTFGLKPVRELGVTAALGVVWILLLAVFFLPALHLVGKKERAEHSTAENGSLVTLFDRVLLQQVLRCGGVVRFLSRGKRPWGILSGVCGLFILIALLVIHGQIESRTRALEFIRGTLVERTARLLNQPGNVGFEFLDLLVEPANGETLYDPHFLRRAWEWQRALAEIPGGRETTSILSALHRIAQESFGKEFPETGEEVEAAFFLVEQRLSDAVQRQLYFPGGVRIAISYGTDDSIALGRLRERALALARHNFPDLRVSAFNKASLYPQVDHYVRVGKITNVFLSQFGIALICGLLIAWRNRRLSQQWLSPLRGGLTMSLPLFFATVVLGLVMWVLKIPLDMATASIGALTMNAATDFSLYLAMTYQKALRSLSAEAALDTAMGQQGRIIIADCLLNTVCFLPLLLSSFLPVRELGWMMGVMLTACAGGALIGMALFLPRCVVKGAETKVLVTGPMSGLNWARTRYEKLGGYDGKWYELSAKTFRRNAMKTAVLLLALLCPLFLLPQKGRAALSAEGTISLARRHLVVPAEFVLGEMKVYRQDKLHRAYTFIMGRAWDGEAQTESVRVDFKTAIDSSLHSDHRYLLKRTAQTPATQWLYVPALRRVRIVPYQPDDPLLQSDYLFYDLTAIQNFGDYHYRFIDADGQTPVIEGTPRENGLSVPYERAIFRLEKRGDTYLVTEIQGIRSGKEKRARFSAFSEITPGRYRPQKLTVESGEGARTDLVFQAWIFSTPAPQLLTPTHLETQTLTVPVTVR